MFVNANEDISEIKHIICKNISNKNQKGKLKLCLLSLKKIKRIKIDQKYNNKKYKLLTCMCDNFNILQHLDCQHGSQIRNCRK